MAKKNETNGAASTSTEAKRAVSRSSYIDAEGTETRSPDENTVALRFSFEGGESRDFSLDDINESIKHMAVCQGLNIKLQRAYNTAKGNVAQMIEDLESTIDNLRNGVWTSEREGGLRIGDLAEAVVQVLASEGKTVELETVKAKLAADEGTRAKSKANPKVAAALAVIVANKAAARAQALGVTAQAHTAESGLDFS